MEYEKLGRHLRDFANHEVWYLHQGQRETCVSVSQTKIFFSDALRGFFFFPHCCHFCTFFFLELWELVIPLEQRYGIFPPKSLIHMELLFC